MRQKSFLPEAYKLQRNLLDEKASSRSVSREKKAGNKRRGSQSSKYSYDKQKQVNKQAEKNKGGKFS